MTTNAVAVTHSASIQAGSTLTMRDLRNLAETNNVPDSARVEITHYPGDFREAGYTTVKLTWTT